MIWPCTEDSGLNDTNIIKNNLCFMELFSKEFDWLSNKVQEHKLREWTV